MPTSRFLLRMTRGKTGVISRIKFHAVVDPSTVSLVPRTVKPYSIWTVRHRPQQRHKQALHHCSASPFTSLCIPLHGSSVCHTSIPPKPRISQYKPSRQNQTKFSLQNTQATFVEPSESDKNLASWYPGNFYRAVTDAHFQGRFWSSEIEPRTSRW